MTEMQARAAAGRTPSQLIADEVRAEAARQGLSLRQLAFKMGVSQPWMSRRVKFGADVALTIEDVLQMAEALDVPVERFLSVLPRLDSNQQPSGSLFSQVSGVWSDPFLPGAA